MPDAQRRQCGSLPHGAPLQAVPNVSDVEAQMFSTMVDVNGDGVISEQEMQQSLADCAAIDAAVTGARPACVHPMPFVVGSSLEGASTRTCCARTNMECSLHVLGCMAWLTVVVISVR